MTLIFKVADEIRDLIEEHQEANAFPVVLEIPSKEHPYDPEKDSVIKKIQRMFGKE
jgi:V-type H+-transporting ATPase subunit F